MKSLQDDVQKAFDVLINHSPGSLEADALRSEIVDKTEEAVRSLVRGDQLLTRLDKRFVIEALIKLTGRPAFKIDGGAIAKPEQAQSEWKGILMIGETAIQKLSQSVGRIDLEGDHVGTGFVIGPGLVMTNRHVAEAIADVVVGRDGIQKWFLRENVTINFDDRAKDPTKQFKVRSIVSAGPNKIGTRVDFHNLDLAILDIETTNAYDKKLPGRLPLSGDSADAGFRQDLFVMGYPARPGLSSLEDPHGEITEEEIARRLAVLFGLDYGRKYMCPGRLELTPGAALEDPRGWIMTHDTSTLPGCSGAPLCRFTDDLPVLGLHFAGSTLTANYAHALSIVRTAPSPLSTLDLEWV